jgi:cell division initiation protein
MTLSPFEAERREFGRAPFGYKPRDVDHFVDEVQRSLRELWQERGDAREENERLKERLQRYEQLEEQLKNTLLLAQDSAEKAHEQARRESELILREAGQKSRDIVHAAHEDKQRLEMVLRDLHGAETEARQRLRALSGAILSHLDDTEQLVAESTGNLRAIVQAHPEASELRSSSVESMSELAERAALAAEIAVAEEAETRAERVAFETERTERAQEAERTPTALAAERVTVEAERERPRRFVRTATVDSLETGVASGETADAFFDAPPTFDHTEVADRRQPASFADVE